MNDDEIVDLFIVRNEAAIGECDKKYGIPLRSLGNRITNDTGTTEECIDDTYMGAWQTIPPSEPRGFLFTYLAKIMRGKCIDHLRAKTRIKRGSTVTVLSDELAEAAKSEALADSAAIKNELVALIEKFLLSQKDEARYIFVLRYFYMEEIRGIASRLYITEGKVKTVLKRLRDKLRLFLQLYGYTVGGGDVNE